LAFFALIGLITCVNALMSDQITNLYHIVIPNEAYLRERFATAVKIAHIWLAIIVHPFML
jgi:hypothetical protein